MTLYVILTFVAILTGMAISVAAFGTGTKRARVLKEIYYSIEDVEGMGVLYTKTGEYSVIMRVDNPIVRHSADAELYYQFTSAISTVMQSLGEGYAIHKQDIFTRRRYQAPSGSIREYLSDCYFRFFQGREYTDSSTYLTITQENRKTRLLGYDSQKWKEFLAKVSRVHDLLEDRGFATTLLDSRQARSYVDRYFTMDYASAHVSMNNFQVTDSQIGIGGRKFKIYSLVDVDSVSLPPLIRPYTDTDITGTTMPVDLMSVIADIPQALNVVYNQVIYLPNQKHELSRLSKKKNRHSSLPSPSNQIAVEDIKRVEEIIARENRQLVYCHYNLIVTVDAGTDLQKCTNYLENAFSRLGIHLSQRAYNQLELFTGSFPGNCYSLNEEYDRFLTMSEAASCLMYKERQPQSEDTPLKVYYTDRQGRPLAIDISGKEGTRRLTNNSNFFCLGPSGTGKSFHMNSIVRQLWEQDTDVVIVDTGNSYEGLCEYVGGKYISYTEQHPITMNPFHITRQELNIEKIGFLKNVVMLIWKGTEGEVSKTEDRLIEQVITEYYDAYFNGFTVYSPTHRTALEQELAIEMAAGLSADASQQAGQIQAIIREREERRRAIQVTSLSFNTFYEYSIQRIPQICSENHITGIDIAGYRYMMREFFRGGKYESTLNEAMDTPLFDETFIVFELDSIKNDPLLFPLVTLILMDVFIQKMFIKKNRKMLVIEEAWKAIASPIMAEYIKYMYKTARKHWAMVGVVTQELQDIIGSPVVKEAIINNSDITILQDQSKFKERFDEIRTTLGLTDVECRKIFTINRLDNKENRSFFLETFVRRGISSDVYGVEEPRECYMTYTTERAEKEALKIYRGQLGCSHQQAIQAYCADWEKSGITSSLEFAKQVNSHPTSVNHNRY